MLTSYQSLHSGYHPDLHIVSIRLVRLLLLVLQSFRLPGSKHDEPPNVRDGCRLTWLILVSSLVALPVFVQMIS